MKCLCFFPCLAFFQKVPELQIEYILLITKLQNYKNKTQVVYTHVHTRVKILETRLAEAGNVFRSITRSERARCTLKTHAHTQHVFPMEVTYGRVGQPYIMRSSGLLDACVCVPICMFLCDCE